MKIRFTILLLFWSFISMPLLAQKHTAYWHFGNNATVGFDFSSDPPVIGILPNNSMSTQEGCASVSDTNANMQFYTDGRTVYDRTNTAMPNGTGLKGSNFSSQSAVIVPLPNSDSIYYIITVGDWLGTDGLNYSIVDMRLRGGLGDVTQKNQLLHARCREQIGTAYHGNCRDTWVIGHIQNTDSFVSYNLTPTGFAPAPVYSKSGTLYSGNERYGAMKVSPNNGWIACAMGGPGLLGTDATLDLHAFNSYTGTLDSFVTIGKAASLPSLYSVEFSPLSTKLYACELGGKRVIQFDLGSGLMQRIPTPVYIVSTEQVNVLQLAADGRIYLTGKTRGFIDVINYPELGAINVDYRKNFLPLDPGSSAETGLPGFVPVLGRKFPISFTIRATPCPSSPSKFSLTGLPASNLYVYNWDFGDTSYSSERAPSHQYSYLGSFKVKITITDTTTKCYRVVTDSVTINIDPNAILELGRDTAFCDGTTQYPLQSNITGTYEWSTGDTSRKIQATSSDLYKLKVTTGCGVQSDSIRVEFSQVPNAFLGNDTVVCGNTNFTLGPIGNNDGTVRWSTGDTTRSLAITQSGTYSVIFTNACGVDEDTINVTVLPPPTLNLGGDQVICPGSNIVLDSKQTVGQWLWSTGETTPQITVTDPGTYWVIYGNVCDTLVDSVSIAGFGNWKLPPQTMSSCEGKPITLSLPPGLDSYRWSTGDTTNSVSTLDTGLITVSIVKDACTAIDTFWVHVTPPFPKYVPNAFSPNGDALNEIFPAPVIPFQELQVFNRWGELVYKGYEKGWNGTLKSGSVASDGVFYYILTYYGCEQQIRKGTITLIR